MIVEENSIRRTNETAKDDADTISKRVRRAADLSRRKGCAVARNGNQQCRDGRTWAIIQNKTPAADSCEEEVASV